MIFAVGPLTALPPMIGDTATTGARQARKAARTPGRLSIDPILSLPGVRKALRACRAPVVAVSPIIGGKAVKGPTAKIMAELGLPVGAVAIARHYADILDIYVADEADTHEVGELGIPVRLTHTLMRTLEDRDALARAVLAAAGRGF